MYTKLLERLLNRKENTCRRNLVIFHCKALASLASSWVCVSLLHPSASGLPASELFTALLWLQPLAPPGSPQKPPTSLKAQAPLSCSHRSLCCSGIRGEACSLCGLCLRSPPGIFVCCLCTTQGTWGTEAKLFMILSAHSWHSGQMELSQCLGFNHLFIIQLININWEMSMY